MSLVEQRVFARPTSEDEAKAVLEWLASREGKTLAQLVEEQLGVSAREDVLQPRVPAAG
jgi:hypothetical protein